MLFSRLFAGLLPVLLCACSLAPAYVRPETGLPPAYGQAQYQADNQSYAAEDAANRAWWGNFNSRALPRLQALALANNHDFAAQRWVLAQALARARAARADLVPSVDVSGGISRGGREGNAGYQVSDTVKGSVQAAYELDLWGANRETAASGAYQALASFNAWRGAGLSLESEVALTYFSYLAARENLRVYASMLDNAKEVLAYQETRERHGAAAPLDVTRQRSSVRAMEAEHLAYQQRMLEARNNLCLLLGTSALPEDLAALMDGDGLRDILPPAVNPGLPSDLLLRRPDIAEAEASLLAANADIGVARAAFLPSFSLTAAAGYESDFLHNLFSPASALYSLAGSMLAPVFNNGELIARLDEAWAAKEELIERYRQAALNGFWEVSTALDANALLDTQEQRRREAAEQAGEAYRIARVRYEQGAEDFLAVLDAQDSMLSADNSLVQVRLERLNSSVALFKALGGGWGEEGDLAEIRRQTQTAPGLTF